MNTNMDMNSLITATEMAKILKISRALSYRLISQGEIPSVHIGKATIRVKAGEVLKLIERNTCNAQQVQPSNSEIQKP